MNFVLAAAASYYYKVPYSDNVESNSLENLYAQAYGQYVNGLVPSNYTPSFNVALSHDRYIHLEMCTQEKVYGSHFNEYLTVKLLPVESNIEKINKITVGLCELKHRLDNKLYGNL